MKFHNRPRRRKIKRYRKIHTREYAVVFKDSNDLINFISDLKSKDIINSSLYTCCGYYQLILSCNTLIISKNAVFKDKPHLDEIKTKSRVICKNNAIPKLQKAFKET